MGLVIREAAHIKTPVGKSPGFGALLGQVGLSDSRRAGEYQDAALALSRFVGSGKYFGGENAFGKLMYRAFLSIDSF